ncbi:transmembrane protein [Heterostelium album PN500]|uniref:Transmembrane protein n=1 Tax=Heterostelium pallidum (strain ATCC 26659 / Pp 5 / PN500) TaxID=670386 RepID=D3B3C9_HETP5|nr:transmembrane protein [Heterostelium album PN500]EFA83827.1 transmembrane protein [Heterostelium album PN500]|eukprot:XP_020435944.1 transmembrane protein [Heterostelium album PN500]
MNSNDTAAAITSNTLENLYHHINKHQHFHSDCLLSVIRGLRNGILTGVRIRIPYIFQAVIYAAIFRDAKININNNNTYIFKIINILSIFRLLSRVKFVVKQMFFHGRNLGMFVGIYKLICCVFRKFGIKGGVESLIAGFVGGYYAFGESKGTSGSVNNQIVLYLFARALIGFIQSGVKRKIIPESLSTTTPTGFRIFAGVTLALILYLTEYEPDTLNSSFMGTMTYLYHKSDSGPMLHNDDKKFSPIIFVVLFINNNNNRLIEKKDR